MPAPKSLNGASVLIVEDEMLSALDIESILQELGCEVIGVASDIDSAISAINGDNNIDCATLDIGLGAEIATSVARALISKGIPFVVCSGYDIYLRECPSIPMVDKPFTKRQLEAGLNRALGLKAAA